MEVAAVARDGVQEHGLRIKNVSYITVQDIAVVNTTHTAVLVTPSSGYDTNHIVLRRLTVRNAGFTGIEVNNSLNSGPGSHEIRGLVIKENIVYDTNYHGIILAYGVAGAKIQYNTVYTGHLRLGSHGISTWSNKSMAYVHDCTIEGNTVRHSKTDRKGGEGTGIHADNYTRNNLYRNNVCSFNEGSGFHAGLKSSGCKFHYNIGFRNGTGSADSYRGGITLAEPQNVQIFNNVFYDNYPCGLCWFGEAAKGVTLKNNVIFDNAEYEIKVGVKAGSNVVSDHNCVFHRDGGRFMKWVGSDCTWKEWKNISGKDDHSVNRDPRFVDPEDGDFNLHGDSPCIDAGTYVGLSRDFDGNDVPRGKKVDIGAFEFFEEAPIAFSSDIMPSCVTAAGPVPARIRLKIRFLASIQDGAGMTGAWKFPLTAMNQKAAAGNNFLK